MCSEKENQCPLVFAKLPGDADIIILQNITRSAATSLSIFNRVPILLISLDD
jgi:hypothetical protein